MLFLSLIAINLLINCQTEQSKWAPRMYVGMPDKEGIGRDNGNEVVKCSQPDFNDYICMSEEDVEKLFNECLEKKKWYKF